MRINQKFLSVILVGAVTLGGVLYTSSDDSAFFGDATSYNVVQPTPQLNIKRHVVRSNGSSQQSQNEGIATAPSFEGSNGFSQDRPASISTAPLTRRVSSSTNYASNRRQNTSSQQGGGAIFHRASSRSGSAPVKYAQSSFSTSALASSSLESDLSSTRSAAPYASNSGAMDPGGDPTGSAIPISDGTPILILLAIGYAFWKFRKVSATA